MSMRQIYERKDTCLSFLRKRTFFFVVRGIPRSARRKTFAITVPRAYDMKGQSSSDVTDAFSHQYIELPADLSSHWQRLSCTRISFCVRNVCIFVWDGDDVLDNFATMAINPSEYLNWLLLVRRMGARAGIFTGPATNASSFANIFLELKEYLSKQTLGLLPINGFVS